MVYLLHRNITNQIDEYGNDHTLWNRTNIYCITDSQNDIFLHDVRLGHAVLRRASRLHIFHHPLPRGHRPVHTMLSIGNTVLPAISYRKGPIDPSQHPAAPQQARNQITMLALKPKMQAHDPTQCIHPTCPGSASAGLDSVQLNTVPSLPASKQSAPISDLVVSHASHRPTTRHNAM